MVPQRDRLIYLFGEENIDHLADYDLTQESDVIEVVERFLLLPHGTAEGGIDGMRAVVLTVAVRQILDDAPPETWQAAVRMRDHGMHLDQVLRELSMVISEHLMAALAEQKPVDAARLTVALDALPLPSTQRIAEALVGCARRDPGIHAGAHVRQTVAELEGCRTNVEVIEDLVERVLEQLVIGPLHWLAGDVTVPFFDAMLGRTFTHRLNQFERDGGVLGVAVDLAGFQRFAGVRLSDGTELEQFSMEEGHQAWAGQDGWLDEFTAGDLLAVTAEFSPPIGDEPVDATITLRVVPEPQPVSSDLVATVRSAYDSEQHEHGLPVSTEDLVIWLCHHQDTFTTPLPPLGELIELAGLQLNGSFVAHDASVWRQDLLAKRTYRMFDLVVEPALRKVLGRAIEVLPNPDADIEEVRRSLEDCADDAALETLADLLLPELLGPEDEFEMDGVHSPGQHFEMVHRAIAVARRPRQVATAEYLACVLRERCGQPLLALEHLSRSAAAQPRLGPVVERMGWYCFDRGDARGAMRWWHELEEEHPGAAVIARFLGAAVGEPRMGRNDPCWCGSGRKFKQCHQLANELPALPDRVGWLCRKASLWVEHSTGEARTLVTDLAIAYVTGDPEAEAADALGADDEQTQLQFQEAFADPILFDAALHEGGLFQHFLHDRGDLLPEDERLLATAWLTVERSVHEVMSVQHGVGLELRDLATGDVVDVHERTLSKQVQVGERFCARVVPDGSSHQIIGGLFEVRTGHEQQVLDLCLEADAAALCAWAGAAARPPRIVHTPGMFDSMFDRDALEAVMGDDSFDEPEMIERLNAELSRQAQARWPDERVPALGGMTPRAAAADPTMREQLARMLDEMDRRSGRLRDARSGEMTGAIVYDINAIRRELGLT